MIVNSPEYHRLHDLVKRERGLATQHPCAECGVTAGRREWANISGTYSGVDDFRPLCVSCHRREDHRKRHDARQDHTFDPARTVPRCRECFRRWHARHRATVYERTPK